MKRQNLCLILHISILAVLIVPSLLSTPDRVAASPAADVDLAVVKIESRTKGIGTGVVVSIDGDTASIVTAAHVVEDDTVVEVSISPRADLTYQAQVKKTERDTRNGLALIVLRGEIVRNLRKLNFDTVDPNKDDAVFTVGFPGSGAPWTHMPGRVSGRDGLIVKLSSPTEDGNSGGPVINERSGKAVGLVMRQQMGLGHAIPASTIRATLAGWGVRNSSSQYSYALRGTIQYIPCGSNTVTTYSVDRTYSQHALYEFENLFGHFTSVSLQATQLTNGTICTSAPMGNSPHQHMHPVGLVDDSTTLNAHIAKFAVGSQGTPGPFFKGGWQGDRRSGCMYMEVFFEPSTACDNR